MVNLMLNDLRSKTAETFLFPLPLEICIFNIDYQKTLGLMAFIERQTSLLRLIRR